MRRSKAWPHPVCLCPFVTFDCSPFLEKVCLPPGAGRAVSLHPLAVLHCSSSPAPWRPLFADAAVPVVLVCGSCGFRPHCCLGKPQVVILLLGTPGATQGSSRDAWLLARMCVLLWECTESLLSAVIGETVIEKSLCNSSKRRWEFQQAIPTLRLLREELVGRYTPGGTFWVLKVPVPSILP